MTAPPPLHLPQTTTGGPDRRNPAAFLSTAILLLFVVISYVDRMAIILLVEPLKRDLGITDLQVSLLQGLAFALCFGLAAPVLGWVADRRSPRYVIFGGMIVWSLATAACGLAGTFPAMFAARFVVGVGEAALMPAAFVILADLYPRRELATACGVLAAGSSAGAGIAIAGVGLLAGWAESPAADGLPLVDALAPWQLVFVIIGLPGVLLSALIFLIPERRRPAASGMAGPAVSPLPWMRSNARPMFGFTLAVGLLYAISYGAINWTPTFFIRAHGWTLTQVGAVLGPLQFVAGAVGFVASGLLFDRLNRYGVRNPAYVYLTVSLIVAATAAVVAFGLSPDAAVSFVALGVFHLAIPFTGVMAAHIQFIAPRPFRAFALAVATTVSTLLGMIAGPSGVAWFTERIFRNEGRLGSSIAIMATGFAVVALGLLWASRVTTGKLLEDAGDAGASELVAPAG